MRSICSTGMFWKAAAPSVAELILTPSISTRVWSELVPRRNTEVTLPGPPLLETVTPGRSASRSPTERACWRSMSSRVMTLTEASVSDSVRGVRVAVTITGSPWVSAKLKGLEKAASTARAAADGRMVMMWWLPGPAVRPRRSGMLCVSEMRGRSGSRHDARHRHPAALPPESFQAGLRAREVWRSRGTPGRPHRLPGPEGPVASDAAPSTYRCGGSTGIAPVSRLSPGREAAGHLKRLPFLRRAPDDTRIAACALHHGAPRAMTCELILGGARSGKSRLAQSRAEADGRAVTVIATAEALDEEMAQRIARHRAERPGHWRTVEAPRGLASALRAEAAAGRCLVVDCLTLWLANLLGEAEAVQELHDAAHLPALATEREALLAALPTLPGRILLVANEVGLGLVPETPLGRLFRDEAGRLNQQLAALHPDLPCPTPSPPPTPASPPSSRPASTPRPSPSEPWAGWKPWPCRSD